VDAEIIKFSEPVCFEEIDWNLAILPEESTGSEIREDTLDEPGCKARNNANDVHIGLSPKEVDVEIIKFSEPVCLEEMEWNSAILPEESAGHEIREAMVQAVCKARDDVNDIHIGSGPKEVDVEIFNFSEPFCFEDTEWNLAVLPEESASSRIRKDTVNNPGILQTGCKAGDAILTGSSPKEANVDKINIELVSLEDMEWNLAILPEELLHFESEFTGNVIGEDHFDTEIACVDGADVEPDWSEDSTFYHFGSEFFVDKSGDVGELGTVQAKEDDDDVHTGSTSKEPDVEQINQEPVFSEGTSVVDKGVLGSIQVGFKGVEDVAEQVYTGAGDPPSASWRPPVAECSAEPTPSTLLEAVEAGSDCPVVACVSE